jgi:DNA helicase HerA-like ATPase
MAIDLASTIASSSVFDMLQSLLNQIKVLIGGVFGIYVIMLIIRLRDSRRNSKLLGEIRDNLKALNAHLGVHAGTSSGKKKIYRWLKRRLKASRH